jgi:4-amino-4-deoxy-L-arabinose transferase-like glycosyltransferase
VAGGVIAAGALVASAVVADRVFERLPHLEDEFAHLWQAQVMARGEIALPSPPEPESFLVPFVVDHEGQRFGKYPPGWPAALSLAARAQAAWALNPLLAAAAVWLTYRLGGNLAGKGVGLLAAGLMATSPMLWMLSGSMMSHNLSLVLTLALALAWIDLFGRGQADRRGRLPAALLTGVAGLSLGLMVLTRPLTAVGVGLPFAAHGAYILWKGGPGARKVLAVAALALVTGGMLLIWQAAVTGSPLRNPYTLWWPYDRVGFGPGFGRTASGHSLEQALRNAQFSLAVGAHDLYGWPYLSWAFLPFGLAALRRRGEVWLVFGILPGLVITYLAYWIGSWLLGPRYYYEALPAASVVTAAGVASLAGASRQAAGRWDRARRTATGALLGLLVALNLAFYLPARVGGLRGLYGVERRMLAGLDGLDLGRALILVHPQESWVEYGVLLNLAPPFRDSHLLFALSRGEAVDDRVAASFRDRAVYHYYPGEMIITGNAEE